MSDGQDTSDDLPGDIARMLRDVPPADPALREVHIAAALGETRAGSGVTRVDFRRRVLLSAAAAAIALAAGGLGWSARGSGSGDMAATGPRATTVTAGTAGADTGPTVKGSGGPTSLPGTCNLQVIDSVYVGEYMNPTDGKTYAVYTFGGELEFVDRATCARVDLVGVPVSAVSTTTAP